MSEFKYEGATMTIPMYQHTTMLDTTTDAVTVGIGVGQEDTANAVTGAVYVTEGSTDVAAAVANGTGAGNTAIDDVNVCQSFVPLKAPFNYGTHPAGLYYTPTKPADPYPTNYQILLPGGAVYPTYTSTENGTFGGAIVEPTMFASQNFYAAPYGSANGFTYAYDASSFQTLPRVTTSSASSIPCTSSGSSSTSSSSNSSANSTSANGSTAIGLLATGPASANHSNHPSHAPPRSSKHRSNACT
ncbi:hypothetical protein WR25_05545 [Diploscapter pachys]|uniref:Uncharacterized protein n=1 Tax=Diploscapter pachys TaxID=2018661 RepID=A0A2A2J958_9BILA|nr:hypothetical protein WR25_05545 [Diploscapter pachys]